MTISNDTLASQFLEYSQNKLLHQYWPRLRTAVESLSNDQLWWRPNTASNSVGNLVLHLNGNVTQWLIASFNKLEDARNRTGEFNERRRIAGKILLDQLAATMDEAGKVLARLTAEDLSAMYEIQGYTVSGMAAIYQVVEHFGLHYGQIIYITKSLTSEDLGFYSELNATGRPSLATQKP